MEKLFELSCQDQTLNPQIGTFTDASQTTGTFTLEDGEYYLTNGDTKGFYAYSPVAMQSGLVNDSKVIIEFDLKVVTASANTHAIIGTYAGVDGNGIPTGAKITLQYNAGDIELVLGSGTTATLIAAADVVVDQWYHFRIDCYLAAPLASTYQVKIDGIAVTTVTGATADYELGVISVLGTDLHACDECGIKNITFVTETNLYVGRTALDQALQDVKGYVDSHCVNLTGSQTIDGTKTFNSQIKGTIDKSKDYYLSDDTLASTNGSLGTVKYYSAADTADLDTAIFEHSLWDAQKAFNSIPVALDSFYYIDQYFYSQRTATSNRIQILRGYRNASLQMVRVYNGQTNSWSEWKKFADDSDVVHKSGDETVGGNKDFSGTTNIQSLTINGTAAGDILTHNASEFVPRSGGAVMNGVSYARTVNNSSLVLCGGTNKADGAYITLAGNNADYAAGFARIITRGTTIYYFENTNFAPSGAPSLGAPNYRWGQIYSTNSTISTSDSRLKNSVKDIDDKLLNAWENIEPKQYKFNDATEKKGEKARFHTGYLAQDIQAECEKQGVNASDYGLFCYDEWEEQEEESEEIETEKDGKIIKEKRIIQPRREKGNSYALRYEEALVVECKYLRRCIARLTARIEELEKGNNTK